MATTTPTRHPFHHLLSLPFLSLLLSLPSVLSQCTSPTPLPSSLYNSTSCAFAGFDFAPLAAVDLFATDSSNSMTVFRLCGAVSEPTCAASASPSSTSQLCAWSNTPQASPACGPVNSTLTSSSLYHFAFLNSSNPLTGGVFITAYPTAPLLCNGVPPLVLIRLLCSPAAAAVPTSLNLDSVVVNTTACPCTTTISLTTSLACAAAATPSSSTGGSSAPSSFPASSSSITAPPSPTSTLPAASSSSSSTGVAASAAPSPVACLSNPFGLNLSSLGSPLQWADNATSYYVNLCGVTDASSYWCALFGPGASVCRYSTCNPAASRPVGFASAYQPTRWRVTDGVTAANGVEYLQANGAACGNTKQQVVVRIVCDPTASSPFISSIVARTSCTLLLTIHTSLTCALVVTDPTLLCPSGCCGLGYDLSALSYDVYGYDSYPAVWALHLCGAVNSLQCNGSQLCQDAACPTPGYSVSSHDPSLAVWSFVNGANYSGGLQVAQANGQVCRGLGPRVQILRLLCDPTAVRPNTLYVTESPTCVYRVTVYTAVVCGAPSFNSSAMVLSAVMPHVAPVLGCQFQGYDLSPLSAYDLYIPYQYYLFVTRVCGAVTDRVCARSPLVANSSVCQLSTGGSCGAISTGGEYLVSTWNPYIAQSQLLPGGGVQVQVQDGANCGNGPRTVKWIFLCDPAATRAYAYSVVEEQGNDYCHYDIIIMTQIACAHVNVSAASSSSTGHLQRFNSTNGASSRPGAVWLWGLAVVALSLLS